MTRTTSDITESMTVGELLQLNLDSLESELAVANTPLFLLRKLRTSSVAKHIAQDATVDNLLKALGRSVKKRPRTLRTMLRPYLFLVALGMKGDPAALTLASKLDAPHHGWVKPIVEALMASQSVTASRTYRVPPKVKASPSSSTSAETVLVTQGN